MEIKNTKNWAEPGNLTIFSRGSKGNKTLAFWLSTGFLPADAAKYAALSTEESYDTPSPANISPGWERIIIKCMETGQAATVKVDPYDFILLGKRAEAAICSPSAPVSTVSYAELKFPSGKYNGFTPSEALFQQGATKEEMVQYLNFLVDKPSMAQLFNSICHALAPKPAVSVTASAGVSTWLDMKYLSTSEQNENGENKFYDFSVLYDQSRNYPITFVLTNYWAKLIIRPDKTQSPAKEHSGVIKLMFSMTLQDLARTAYHFSLYKAGIYAAMAAPAQRCIGALKAAAKEKETT